jgi:hypothetical protein
VAHPKRRARAAARATIMRKLILEESVYVTQPETFTVKLTPHDVLLARSTSVHAITCAPMYRTARLLVIRSPRIRSATMKLGIDNG